MKYGQVTFVRTIALAVMPFIFIMASCEEELVGAEKGNTPTSNFEVFWRTFDTHYGLFEVKKINWNEVYDEYRPQVSDEMSDAAFYEVLKKMILLLHDNHVNLYPTNGELPVFPGGVVRHVNGEVSILKVQEDYALDVVKNYVNGFTELTPNLGYGRIGDNLGYINFSGTDSRKSVEKSMEKILNDLGDTHSLIIDIRGNYGGMDAVSQYIAGCFANEEKLYMTSRKRNGPAHDQFAIPTEWYVSPAGSKQYTGPVILLTSRFTQSAGETFALAMDELSHVTLAGDTTAGSFSDNPSFEMNNGWIFNLSVGDYRASDGSSYEGVGIAPDIAITTTKGDLLAGKDPVLEKAIMLASN